MTDRIEKKTISVELFDIFLRSDFHMTLVGASVLDIRMVCKRGVFNDLYYSEEQNCFVHASRTFSGVAGVLRQRADLDVLVELLWKFNYNKLFYEYVFISCGNKSYSIKV